MQQGMKKSIFTKMRPLSETGRAGISKGLGSKVWAWRSGLEGPGSEGLGGVLLRHAIIGKLRRLELSSCSVSLKHLLSDLYPVGLILNNGLILAQRKGLNNLTKFGLEINSPN